MQLLQTRALNVRQRIAMRLQRAMACVALLLSCGALHAQRLVLIDQDASGPGGSDQMSMMVLLQSPDVRVLGITTVSGDMWAPEETQHTLRMLELIHRTDVPVVQGAVFPLVHTREEAMLDRAMDGSLVWYGAWTATKDRPYHGPFVVPPLIEGAPATKPLAEDAAHFLLRMVRAHPHQVTVYAGGPLTNIALAISLDPEFASLAQGIVIMGGSLDPQTSDPEFATHPRHEFNFWFDPESAHIVLRANWPSIELTTADISLKTRFTKEMVATIAKANTPAAQYIAKYTTEYGYCWDELEAAALVDPAIITRHEDLYVDVDLTRGPNYGDTLTWSAANKPERPVGLVHIQQDLDRARFEKLLVQLMSAAPQSLTAAPQSLTAAPQSLTAAPQSVSGVH
jgi:purine nucleosidase